MSEDLSTQIREMAKISLVTKRISDVQITNLMNYPFIFFDGVKRVEIGYDLNTSSSVDTVINPETADISYSISTPSKSGSVITYKIDLLSTEFLHPEVRYKALERAVRDLFWNDIRVEIYLNDKLSYETPDNG